LDYVIVWSEEQSHETGEKNLYKNKTDSTR